MALSLQTSESPVGSSRIAGFGAASAVGLVMLASLGVLTSTTGTGLARTLHLPAVPFRILNLGGPTVSRSLAPTRAERVGARITEAEAVHIAENANPAVTAVQATLRELTPSGARALTQNSTPDRLVWVIRILPAANASGALKTQPLSPDPTGVDLDLVDASDGSLYNTARTFGPKP